MPVIFHSNIIWVCGHDAFVPAVTFDCSLSLNGCQLGVRSRSLEPERRSCTEPDLLEVL